MVNDKFGGFHAEFLDSNEDIQSSEIKNETNTPFGLGDSKQNGEKSLKLFCIWNWGNEILVQKTQEDLMEIC